MHTQSLLKELNLGDRIKWKETKTGFFTDGKLYSMSNTMEFLKFPPLNLFDKFRLGLTILVASWIKTPVRLENITVTQWLRKWSGNRTFEKIWLPLLKAKLGEGYKRTSAAFIWATIQRLYGARNSGSKKEMLGYIEGGYELVIKQLIKDLESKGVKIKSNYKAEELIKGDREKPVIRFYNGISVEFDKVICTLPSGISASVCKDLSDEEILRLKQTEYLGVICTSVLLTRSISPYYITNITDSWLPFTGVIEMTAMVNPEHFGGLTLVYLPKYLVKDDPLLNGTDSEIKDYFIESLKKMYPWITDEHIKFTLVSRARNVIALPTLNYSSKLFNVKTSIPGLYIINSSLITDGTLNVNETLKVAENYIPLINS
jgi:protoporphyrinogen oxidase